MSRDQSIRDRIVEYLVTHGPVEDSRGKATATLKDAVGYEGSDAGFTQTVAAMAKAGTLTREVKGKRTYRISKGAGRVVTRNAPVVDSDEPGVMDYDELAAALLALVTRGAAASTDTSDPSAWARRRLEQLEARNAALQRDVARANAESEAVRAERDALRDQLEAAQHNLNLLTERIGEPRRPQDRAAERLGPDEQTLLHQLRHRRPPRTRAPERAG